MKVRVLETFSVDGNEWLEESEHEVDPNMASILIAKGLVESAEDEEGGAAEAKKKAPLKKK